jgi:spore maturation protein CgeB
VPEGSQVLEFVLEHARGTCAFYDIDTPITLSALRRGDCEYVSRELIGELDLYLSFSGGPILSVLEHEFGARRAEPLYCSVDTDLYNPIRAERTWDLGYLGTYSPDRQPTLERLLLEPARRLPAARFVIAGSQYPEHPAFPDNVARLSHVPAVDHRQFYARQRWTLNVTRQDMIAAGYSPSVRLFEAAACGVPIISDHFAGLCELFEPEREILLAQSAEDVMAHLDLPESTAAQLAARARERILAEHTSATRAKELVRYVETPTSSAQAMRPGTSATSEQQPC